jgi:hypothetical protein
MPHHLCGWQHRWDGPQREYRTLYCAESELTCVREVLADLRPNAKAIAELKELFGDDTPALQGVGEVAAEWRDAHLLCPALAVRFASSSGSSSCNGGEGPGPRPLRRGPRLEDRANHREFRMEGRARVVMV